MMPFTQEEIIGVMRWMFTFKWARRLIYISTFDTWLLSFWHSDLCVSWGQIACCSFVYLLGDYLNFIVARHNQMTLEYLKQQQHLQRQTERL